jgi:selenide,water dikinase
VRRFGEYARSEDPNLLLGLDAPDDAAVYRVTEDLALVQTVDFFTPIVDDPYAWGAIAAANAVSDVYAMGGSPKLALNLVGWPREGLDFELLSRVLEGGADKAAEAGMAIIGGHTIDDPEPKFGMAVTGMVHPDEVVRISGAKAGMGLVLTKPLGTGIISTAIKNDAASDILAAQAVELMSTLNDGAAAAMKEVGVPAATDVTGFGFLGHLQQMLLASGVGAEVFADDMPFLEGVEELAIGGMVPGGTRRNEEHFRTFVENRAGLEDHRLTMLFDSQTSGGLLIVIEEDRLDELVGRLKGAPTAAVVGRTTADDAGRIVIR